MDLLPPLQVNPSRKEVWSENFQTIKDFYEENGHLTLPKKDPDYARLSRWLTYQRHGSTTLRKDQLELLESINYETVPLYRDRDEDAWEDKYNRLKEVYDETGHVKIKDNERGLACWLSRQRQSLRSNKLDPSRRERLGKLGIAKCHTMKKAKSQKLEVQWQAQFEKLKEYKRINGDCNVPHRYEEDRSLGTWVSNQRRRNIQMKDGIAVMNPDRMQKLVQLGFEWSGYDSKRK
jgi:hypothetical protein